MREIKLSDKELNLKENVKLVFEKIITKFGNSAKVDIPKKYIGKRAYIIIVED
jgi:putative transposon-encoded protein